jgi:hypothetical protein
VQEHTRRAQEFLGLCRRLEQITTDYDILELAIQKVGVEAKYYENTFCKQPEHVTNLLAETKIPSNDSRTLIDDVLLNLQQDVTLIRSYNRLYRERAKIGINECFAMVNQQDAEVYVEA